MRREQKGRYPTMTKTTITRKIVSLLMTIAMLLSLASPAMADDVITIGVAQFAAHPSLDNCYAGFVAGLAEEGFIEGSHYHMEVVPREVAGRPFIL